MPRNRLTNVSIDLSKLKTLILSNNPISSNLTLNCPSLLKLSLNHCGLKKLTFLSNLPQLIELKGNRHVFCYCFTKIGNEYFFFFLLATSNEIKRLPKNLPVNSNLRLLDLGKYFCYHIFAEKKNEH